MAAAVTPVADVKSAALVEDGVRTTGLRVFVWPDRLDAWALVDGEAQQVRREPVTSIDRGRAPVTPARGYPWTLLLADGRTVVLERGDGCGCGSPLLRLRPER